MGLGKNFLLKYEEPGKKKKKPRDGSPRKEWEEMSESDKQKRATFAEIFNELDADGGGDISADELKVFLKTLFEEQKNEVKNGIDEINRLKKNRKIDNN